MKCNPLPDEFPTVSETVKEINLLSAGKAPRSDAIPAEIYKAGGLPFISHYMERRSHPSRIHECNSYPPIQTKRESSSLWQSLQESYWNDWINTLNSQGFYQKINVNSERTEEQLTWALQQDSFKRNARNRMWTSTWSLSTLPKHLTQSVVRDFGKLWQSLAVLPNL